MWISIEMTAWRELVVKKKKRLESDDPIGNSFCDYLRSTYQVIGALIIANQIQWRIRIERHDAIVIAIDKSSLISKEYKPIAEVQVFIISLLNDVESYSPQEMWPILCNNHSIDQT